MLIFSGVLPPPPCCPSLKVNSPKADRTTLKPSLCTLCVRLLGGAMVDRKEEAWSWIGDARYWVCGTDGVWVPKEASENSRGQAGSAFHKSTSALWSSCLSHKEAKASFWFLLFLDFCVTKMTLPHCSSSQLLGLPEKWEQCFHGMHAKLLQYLTDGVLPPVWRQFLPRNSVYQLLWSLHQSHNDGRLPLRFKRTLLWWQNRCNTSSPKDLLFHKLNLMVSLEHFLPCTWRPGLWGF